MDALHRNLEALKTLLKADIGIFRSAAREKANEYRREVFLEVLAIQLKKLDKAQSFRAVEDTVEEVHHLCLMCNLWLPEAYKGRWLRFDSLNEQASHGILKQGDWKTYLCLTT